MDFDSKDFRDALGRFATGVTIVTATDSAGEPIGVTVSSYNSVSLDPPLVLWSLARTSRSLEGFEQAKAYTIHVLASEQQDLAQRFATPGSEKFAGLAYKDAFGGAPLLAGCAAHFECEANYQYEGGDHVIFVGRVVKFDKRDTAPLLFHDGNFKGVRHDIAAMRDGAEPHGRFVDDFLPYLIGRAHAQLDYPVREHCRELGMSEVHYNTMGVLSMIGSATFEDLARRIDFTGRGPGPTTMDEMCQRGWLDQDEGGSWRLSGTGRELFLSVLTKSRAMEEEMLADFDRGLVAEAKLFLRLVIEKTAGWLPPGTGPD